MAVPAEYAPVALDEAAERIGRTEAARAGFDKTNPYAWVGFAAEHALLEAFRGASVPAASFAQGLDYDILLIDDATGARIRVEVKTRVTESGWIHPAMFDYVVVPTHDGREPIKRSADLVIFCWWSGDAPRLLWVLGSVKGSEEFKRRATFYPENAPLPRGGWAGKGGAYAIETKQLRPLPRGLLKETEWKSPAS